MEALASNFDIVTALPPVLVFSHGVGEMCRGMSADVLTSLSFVTETF